MNGHNGDGLLAASALTGLLEQLANQALELDAVSQARLAALDGKVLRVCCTAPAVAMDLRFTNHGIRLRGVPDDLHGQGLEAASVDTLVRGPASTMVPVLLNAAGADNPTEALLGSGLEVAGDTGLAADLAAIAANLEPDLEGPLAPMIGNRNAMLLGSAAKGLANLLRGVASGARQQADAALRRAGSAALAEPAEVQRWLDEVDDLRMGIDRLQARMRQRDQA